MKFEGYIVRFRYVGLDNWIYITAKSGSLPQIYTEKGAKGVVTQTINYAWRPVECEMIAVVINPVNADIQIQQTNLTSQ